MRSAVARHYGAPEVLTVEEVPAPTLAAGHVMVRVEAASVGSADSVSRLGDPRFVRLFFGLFRPRNPVFGSDFAGVVVGLGEGVT
ncbi:MAG: NAD(P)-dependent alcohol dehydrogenase, partial [Rhodoglobus sp.]